MKKNNWFYKLETPDGCHLLIDYDKDKARPYVKALLAKVNRLKEVKMLWWLIGISLLFFSVLCVTCLTALWKISALSDSMEGLKKNVNAQVPMQLQAQRIEMQKTAAESIEIENVLKDSKNLLTK